MPSPDPHDLIADDLVARILRARGGQRLLAMSEEEMQHFLSSAESALAVQPAENEAVKASIEDARIHAQERCDLYLAGGGLVTAVALAGAVTVLEERGYAFQRSAGASAGALVAALLSSGYACAEIRDVLLQLDYRRFLDRGEGLLRRARGKGPYSLGYLIEWVEELLAARGVRTFADLRLAEPDSSPRPDQGYRLVVVAADLTRRELVRFPSEYERYGLDPDEQPVVASVAAAVSLPDVFEEVKVQHLDGQTSLLGDAAVLGGQPVDVFDRADGQAPRWPTFAVWARPTDVAAGPDVPERDRARSIVVPVPDFAPADFDLPREQAILLYDAGRIAAEEFLGSWDFGRYVAAYLA